MIITPISRISQKQSCTLSIKRPQKNKNILLRTLKILFYFPSSLIIFQVIFQTLKKITFIKHTAIIIITLTKLLSIVVIQIEPYGNFIQPFDVNQFVFLNTFSLSTRQFQAGRRSRLKYYITKGSLMFEYKYGPVADIGRGRVQVLYYSYLISAKPIKLSVSYINGKLPGLWTEASVACAMRINLHTLFFTVSF